MSGFLNKRWKLSTMNIVNKKLLYRQLTPLIQYNTPVKLANLLLNLYERRTCKIKPVSKPYIAVFDITNTCNLRCDYCPTGKRVYGRKPGMLEIRNVERFLGQVGKYLYKAHLFSWGEPLLHPAIGKIIRLVNSYRLASSISSNFNIQNTELLEELCLSELDHLSLSIDGATQKVYSQYRIGGKLDLVLNNLRYIMEFKRKHHLKKPLIEWQYLIFDHNKHEVETARKMSREIGVDLFTAKQGIVPDQFQEAWGNCIKCPFLWNSVVLQVDGGITACCNLIDKKDDFGDLGDQDFMETWHNSRYEIARSFFSPARLSSLPPESDHPCINCSLLRKVPHLKEYLKNNSYYNGPDKKAAGGNNTISVRSGEKTN